MSVLQASFNRQSDGRTIQFKITSYDDLMASMARNDLAYDDRARYQYLSSFKGHEEQLEREVFDSVMTQPDTEDIATWYRYGAGITEQEAAVLIYLVRERKLPLEQACRQLDQWSLVEELEQELRVLFCLELGIIREPRSRQQPDRLWSYVDLSGYRYELLRRQVLVRSRGRYLVNRQQIKF